MPASLILTVNTGSSSLKVEAFDRTRALASVFKASVKNIGASDATLSVEIKDEGGKARKAQKEATQAADHAAALERVLGAFQERFKLDQVVCVAHRVVHGGTRFKQASKLDAQAVAALRQLIELAPDHMPQALAAIEFFQQRFPSLDQIAAFDTTFHSSMPACAADFGLPSEYAERGLKRFGFHGLSYTYIVQALAGLEPSLRASPLIVAHLGSGASIAAIRNGVSIDTSMGFSPDSGLVMASRAGDIDAAAVLYLMRHEGMSVDDIDELLNKKSGLKGMAGHGGDMQQLLKARGTEASAEAAIKMFCYRIKRYLGSYAAALGGLDLLVFTGGIGENSPEVRAEICADLEFLGIALDREANQAGQDVISTPSSKVKIRVIATDEDLVIAQQAAALMSRLMRSDNINHFITGLL